MIRRRITMKTRKSLAKLILALPLSLLIFACTPQVVLRPNIPVLVDSDAIEKAVAPIAGQDAHFLTLTDFFFLEEPMAREDHIAWVELGKIVQAPSPETDNQAQMLRIRDGVSVWAKWLASTRIATNADIALGKTVIFYDGNWDNYDVRQAPPNNQEARSNTWLMSRITDTSELFKGYVLCGGEMKVAARNLRVIVNR